MRRRHTPLFYSDAAGLLAVLTYVSLMIWGWLGAPGL